MLMCLAASLVGVMVFLRRQSLIGEALSHAAYPGVVLGGIVIGLLFGDITGGDVISLAHLGGAFLTALLGMKLIGFLEKQMKVYPDAALCFVLSFFFGVGILLASQMQFHFSNLYRHVQTYFYGQAATLTDRHILLYGLLVLAVISSLFLLRKEFKAWMFNSSFAQMLGINISLLDTLFLFLVTLSIVIGVRSVGVVLMSAMLIAPAVAARQYATSLKMMYVWAALFGTASAFLGTYLANEGSWWVIKNYPGSRMTLPTGPMIVLAASAFCIGALSFAPERGIISRLIRIMRFRAACVRENLLKTLWRIGPAKLEALRERLFVPSLYLKLVLLQMQRQGWVKQENSSYTLTKEGSLRASHIIRLHRLWELYLADYVGVGPGRVHASAEEMEHILTPELERELTEILHHPTQDPHHQPIPPSTFEGKP
jgi:manganese/zinc/iron transport system permease protein